MARGNTTKFLFDDGEYFVALTDQLAVRIGMQNGRSFDVPMGHAYFERIAEASSRVEVEDLHDELTGAFA